MGDEGEARTREQLLAELARVRRDAAHWREQAAAAEDAQRKLEVVEARFRGLFENSLDGMALHEMVYDEDGAPVDYVFLAVNTAFEEQTGLRAADIVGRRVTEALPGIESDPFIRTYGKVAASGEAIRFEEYSSPLDRHYEVAAYSPRPGQFAVSFHDVSKRKAAERALREHTETLEQLVDARTAELRAAAEELTRSNAELERFAYVASHDLQEPLRTISAFLQLLSQRYDDQLDDKARTYIHFAVDGSEHLRALIQGLLAYSRLETRKLTPQPVDCADALKRVGAVLASSIERTGAELTHDPLPTVLADPTQLHQLLQNLVDNALKFHAPGEAPRIHVGAARAGDRWRLSVRDHGIGIESEYAERVFQVFQRLHTRDEYPGTGIGLALCRRIVEGHGGSLEFEPTPGGGTTFVFDLPAALDGE